MAKRDTYHHGNLKQALVDATLELVLEKGPQGFTLAEAARAAGVSAAAPYRHFKGREDLIQECALQGFAVFADLMEHAYQKGQPSTMEAFSATGRAYLAFARKFPGHYITMFESGISIAGDSALKAASDRAFGVLTHAAEDLLEQMPSDQRPPASMVSHHIWALSHGVVELFTRGAPGAKSPFSPEELLESGTGVYLRGLGLIKADTA